jgi:hypothetical protein
LLVFGFTFVLTDQTCIFVLWMRSGSNSNVSSRHDNVKLWFSFHQWNNR